ncbi:TlpA family protein disulfide reductase [Fimbriiglobus ruber]|uniref:Thioredoxin family protein n=1 Tax=Fimbriiglobus ruber TaxID=1908690 RepID=A0A225DUI6_9BACT|nr:TlpA disulfide reductase family protein [Fimbriiglobus ruber]OWK45180.1 thioredoxin family protein [Fimbriiglobus ruber]
MRVLIATVVTLSVGLVFAFAGDAKETAEKVEALKKKFDTEMADIKDRFEKATTAADRKSLQSEARELSIISARDALELAQDDPKGAAGFEAALFAVKRAGAFGAEKEVEAGAEFIAKNHLDNPQVKTVLPQIAGAGRAGQKFLQTVVEKATDKDARAVALYFQGTYEVEKLNDEDDAKAVDELIAKATDLFDKAVKESPEAKVSRRTVSKEVAEQMEALKAVKNLAVGKPVPDAEARGLDGKTVKLSDYKGKVVLFDIWATWCPPCRAMIPHEREMVSKMKDKPFALVSLSVDDEKDTLEQFLEKQPMPWNHWWDNGQESPILKKFRVRGFPTLFLIDHTGVIRHKWVGSPGNKELDKAVEALVEKAVKTKG